MPGSEAGPGSEDMTVVLPATIGPYVVMRPLGGGGMGVVSLCRTTSGRLVAVKQVREEYADDPAFRSRFRREVAAARRVSGVFTVPVLDADTEGHRPWVASAYIPGPTLDQAVRVCGSFQEPALRALGTGLTEALQAIHGAGLVHRDLKPGNVLLAADGPRVIDFGISKALGETRLTGTGTMIGSPAFMAPEQIASSHDVGPEGDVFSLAGLLVYAACGEGPFGTGDEGALHRVVTAEPDLSGVPHALHPLLQRCLDKTPSRRPTLDEVLSQLAPADPAALLVPALREDLAVRARDAELMAVAPPPPGTVPGTGRKEPRLGRRQALIGGLSVLGVLAAGSAAVVLKNNGDKDSVGKNPDSGKPLGSKGDTVKLTDPPKPLWTATGAAESMIPDLRAFGSAVVLRDSAYVAGFDASTGAVRWGHGTRADGQPVGGKDPLTTKAFILGMTDDKVLFYRMGMDRSFTLHYDVEDVDPATARTRAKTSLKPQSMTPTGLLADHGSTVYCLVSNVEGGSIVPSPGATPNYKVDQTAAAIDLGKGRVLWQKPIVPNSVATMRYAADRHGFYYTEDTDSGLTVHAVDAARGAPRWSVEVPANPDSHLPAYMQGGRGDLGSSLTVAGDLLITINLKGGMTAYDTASGKRRWAVSMTAAAPPVVAGDLILTNDTSKVYAVDRRTGTIRWRITSPVQLSAFSMLGRTIAASEQVTAVLFSTLAVTASGTSPSGGTGGCLVLRTSDGKELWALREKPGSGGPSPSPSTIGGASVSFASWSVAVHDSTVFVSGGGRVRAYRADAG
ncbi:PQQ-binding-like beta-propeller repeat protein [Streptomyces sp. NPDC002928]|uniref:protein kinase domain-containing protein n=1 Tax=Streptomyces sp. NPDC002928 TaxID=3154440 RepID=UPI0033B20418